MAERTVPSVQHETTPSPREETRQPERYISPAVDIYETRDGLTVVTDLPGVDQGGLDVRVAEGLLTLQAQTAHIAPGVPIDQEYQLLHFYRQFELPDEVATDKIRAELKHGVLTLQLPKKEQAKPRRIEVQVA